MLGRLILIVLVVFTLFSAYPAAAQDDEAGRAGVIVTMAENTGAPSATLDRLSLAIPLGWHAQSPESARYEVYLIPQMEELQRCRYETDSVVPELAGVLVRRRVSYDIMLIDLTTDETLAEFNFEGDTPSLCPDSTIGLSGGAVDYINGTPDVADIIAALETALADAPDLHPAWEGPVQPAMFLDYDSRVAHVAFSADGRLFLTGTVSEIQIREAATGDVLHTINGHNDYIWGAAFSPDGTQLVTGSKDTTIAIWDTATGAETRRFTMDSTVSNVSFSPDGTQLLATVGNDGFLNGRAVLLDLASGDVVHEWEEEGNSRIVEGTFNPAGGQVALFYKSSTKGGEWVSVYDLASGDIVLQRGKFEHGTFSPDGSQIVLAGGVDTTITIFDLATGSIVTKGSGISRGVYSLAYHAPYVMVGYRSGRTGGVLWNAETDEQVFKLPEIHAVEVAFSPDGTRLLTGGGTQAIMWDVSALTD